ELGDLRALGSRVGCRSLENPDGHLLPADQRVVVKALVHVTHLSRNKLARAEAIGPVSPTPTSAESNHTRREHVMAGDGVKKQNYLLEPLIGEWSMAMVMPGQEVPHELPDVGARVTFEWMGERAFVLERWRVPIAGAPGGLAVLGWDEGRGKF